MKKNRRWKAAEVARLHVDAQLAKVSPLGPERYAEIERWALTAPTDSTQVVTRYPPSANNSKFRSGKLKATVVEYRRTIGWLYKAAGGKQIDGAVAMEIELYKPAVNVPYDVDNALQNILNGLKGVAYRDDDQVTLLTVAKMWPDGAGRAVVRVKKVTPPRRAAP